MIDRIARVTLVAVIFVIPSLQLSLEQFSLPEFLGSVNREAGLILVFTWLIAVSWRRSMRIPHPLHCLALLFFIWNLVSLTWVSDGNLALDRIIRYVEVIAFSYIIWDLMRTSLHLFAGLQALVAGGLVSAAAILLDYATGTLSHYSAAGRGTSYGFDPNDIACLLAMIVPAAFYLVGIVRRISRVLWLLNSLFVIVAPTAIFLTGSRTGMICGILAVAGGMIFIWKKDLTLKLILLVGVVAGTMLLHGLDLTIPLQRFEGITQSAEKDELSGRLILWEAGWRSFQTHPLLGVGVGQFAVSTPIRVGKKNDVAHNSYLSVLAELGLVGFSCFVTILLVVATAALKGVKQYSAVGVLSLLVWSLGAFTLTWEHVPQTWLLFGMIIAASNIPHETGILRKGGPAQVFGTSPFEVALPLVADEDL